MKAKPTVMNATPRNLNSHVINMRPAIESIGTKKPTVLNILLIDIVSNLNLFLRTLSANTAETF
jgi:hypothetical protein